MITAADRKSVLDSRGQSIIEFLLVLPMMVGLVGLLMRVNTAMQASIVNQQYARLQTHFLTFNSAVYPELRLRKANLDDKGYNQMLIGVSETAIAEGVNQIPDASVFGISSPRAQQGSDEPQTEPDRRAKVRIRSSVTLCTQTQVFTNGSGTGPLMELGGSPGFTPAGPSKLTENSRFDYCRAPQGRYVP